METVFIPQVNEPYAPRDVQLKLTLDRSYLSNGPSGWPPAQPITGLVLLARWPGLTPIALKDEEGPPYLTVHLQVVPPDAIVSRFDSSEERYSPHPLSAHPSTIDQELNLRVTSVPVVEGVQGPINTLYRPLNDSPVYIECYDPANGTAVHCTMTLIVKGLKQPPSTEFVVSAGVGFDATNLGSWAEIQQAVDKFVVEHGELVPFASE